MGPTRSPSLGSTGDLGPTAAPTACSRTARARSHRRLPWRADSATAFSLSTAALTSHFFLLGKVRKPLFPAHSAVSSGTAAELEVP